MDHEARPVAATSLARPAATAGREPYAHAQLARLFNPGSIAVIGASPRAGSFGERTLHGMRNYTGRGYPVNGRYERIGELPCYASVAALPEVPDCVIITAGREAVEGIVRECAAAGVGGAMIYASGYAETGIAERAEQQRALAAIADRSGMRIIGPNCIGMVNFASRAGVTFMAVPELPAPRPGAIGLVSQSGALGFALMQAMEGGASFSHLLTTGNSCDVDVADCIAFLAEEPGCAAVACVFEGMPDPTRLIAAAERCRAAGKPVVVCKLGTGEQGAAAAMSHTGSLAGSAAVYAAAFARAGIVVVQDFEALVDTAAFLAKAGPPGAPGIAVLAASGGAAIVSADRAEAQGVPLPQPGPEAAAVLRARIPEFGSARNPCDVTAQVISDPGSLVACAEAMLGDPAYGALVYPAVYATETSRARMPELSAAAARAGKPILVSWMAGWLEGPGAREAASDPHLSLFRSPDHLFAAVRAWQGMRPRAAEAPVAIAEGAEARAAALLDAAGPVLTEREAKAVLAEYGVPVVPERLVSSAEDAAAAAAEFGFPAVLKVESPDLPHKTEAGVIRLNLRDAAAVREAYDAVMANAAKVSPAPRVNGVLVQPMAPAGVEMLVGARRDPLFGPVVVVGLGGIFAEALRDTATALAPVTKGEAASLIRGLRGAAVLEGFRNLPAVDVDALAEVVARVSRLVADHPGRIEELDVNPLICAGGRIVAVDGLIARGG